MLADLMIWIGKHTQQTHFRYKVADPNQDQSDSHVRLGLLDPDPLFRGTNPDPSIKKIKRKKPCFMVLFGVFFLTFNLLKIM